MILFLKFHIPNSIYSKQYLILMSAYKAFYLLHFVSQLQLTAILLSNSNLTLQNYTQQNTEIGHVIMNF